MSITFSDLPEQHAKWWYDICVAVGLLAKILGYIIGECYANSNICNRSRANKCYW
jgi:hypothetical protein